MLLGLVILSTLLVSVAIARGRFLRQWSDADRQIRQVQVADDLMTAWLAGPPESIPLNGRGETPTSIWRTMLVASPSTSSLHALVVRLDVFDRANARAPAASLQFLVRDVRVPTTRAVTP